MSLRPIVTPCVITVQYIATETNVLTSHCYSLCHYSSIPSNRNKCPYVPLLLLVSLQFNTKQQKQMSLRPIVTPCVITVQYLTTETNVLTSHCYSLCHYSSIPSNRNKCPYVPSFLLVFEDSQLVISDLLLPIEHLQSEMLVIQHSRDQACKDTYDDNIK